MGKSKQNIGKSHNYPLHRQSYSASRAGVGGRPKKKENVVATKSSIETYFNKLRKPEQEQGRDTVHDAGDKSVDQNLLLEVRTIDQGDASFSQTRGECSESEIDDNAPVVEMQFSSDESSSGSENETISSSHVSNHESTSESESLPSQSSNASVLENTESASANINSDVEGSQLNAYDQRTEKHNSLDFRTFKMEKCVQAFPWLYYHPVEKGYKCKSCEMFPSVGLGGGNSVHKFGKVAVRGLSDHPRRLLRGHETSEKHIKAARELEVFKSQHTLESIEEKNKVKKVKESELTKEALLKLIRITIFLVKKHWAHTTNYEDFVKFIGVELGDSVLKEYLKYSESHRNATYLSVNAVAEFVKAISDWMHEETIGEVRNCDHFTLLLDETTDISNRSELSLMARIVKDGVIKNHFLNLLQLRRCDAETIFQTVDGFLKKENIDIKNTRFAGMDGCSTMSGEHNGVKRFFEDNTPHFVYVHCRNHQLALCFAHLIPQYEAFQNFDGLLLDLFLLMKNSSVKQSMFEEVQNSYGLTSLKLIKAAVTRWLSHGRAAQRVLDRNEALVAALEAIYARKKEPAVRGVRDELVKPATIAMMCFLTDVLRSTNVLQCILQGSRLNFLEVRSEVTKLIEKLNTKYEDMASVGSYFGRLDSFLKIANQSAGVRYLSRSLTEFNKENFIAKTARPFLKDLIMEIEIAFDIPEHLIGFQALDPQNIPTEVSELAGYGLNEINSLSAVYGAPSTQMVRSISGPLVNPVNLKEQYGIYKQFIFKKRLEWEKKMGDELADAERRAESVETQRKSLGFLLSKRKQIKLDRQIKTLEKEVSELKKRQVYTCEIAFQQWMHHQASIRHPEITLCLKLAALIPPSTAEVERSFSLMKLICTGLRSRMAQDTLANCMRICKFRELRECDLNEIFQSWMDADSTKSGKRRVASRLRE